jgi:hypothetical protein
VPGAVGVNAAEVAVDVLFAPGVRVTGPEPTAVPPLVQPVALVSGPHTKKLTLPVGAPPAGLPLTVAMSLLSPPRAIDDDAGVVAVVVVNVVTVKHSVALPSVDPG